MVLAKANLTLEHREILLKDRPSSLLNISSKGTVPVLYIDNNHIIDESFDIMIWGIEYAQLDLLKKESQKQFNMIKTNDNDFKYWLDRYKYFDRFPELTINDYQNKCKDFLITYDKILTDNIYFMGDYLQCVDIGLFPFIRQCANVDYNWFQNEFTNLNIWLQKILSSKLFLSTMKKYEVWNQADRGLIVNYNDE